MDVDGVFSGGGIKGLVFVGAYEVLEKRKFRFVRVAGTSAGAVFASLVAAGFSSGEMKDIMEQINFRLLTGGEETFPKRFFRWLSLYWKMGLYRGDDLEEWIGEVLRRRGIETFSDLPPGSLRVVASDVSNGKILVLPDDLPGMGIPFESFPVARAVRMSASIPYFFRPVRIKSGKNRALVVDGGVLSNFPIWLFMERKSGRNLRPILGMKISAGENGMGAHTINNAFQLFEALFATMKDAHDARYISRTIAKNVIFLPVEGIHVTEFSLSEEKKNALLKLGREQAEKFLKTWSY